MKLYIYHGLNNENVPKDITHVIVDNSVTIIKQSAFDHCVHLVFVIMGENVKRIEGKAFNGCRALRSIRLFETLEFIGERAFCCCSSLETLLFPSAVKSVKLDRKGIDQYFKPWDFPNTLGILEVPKEDIEVSHCLGSGKKSSTSQALWRGQSIALKSWYKKKHSTTSHWWELCRYCDLEFVQGRLIPKLYFVSRDSDTNLYMLGLELGEPVSGDEPGFDEAKEELLGELKMTKWVQRKSSFRIDNLVWMKNEDGSRRLVAIDLESFVPYFGDMTNTDNKYPMAALDLDTPERSTIAGLPHISPTELILPGCNSNHRWDCGLDGMKDTKCEGIWKGEEVVVIPYRWDVPIRKYDFLAMLILNESQKEERKSKLLFLGRQRNGIVLLGLPKVDEQ